MATLKSHIHLVLFATPVLFASGLGCREKPREIDISAWADLNGIPSAPSEAPVCVDHDLDGFGLHCAMGLDCNDSDSTIKGECYRCRTPDEDCPCTSEGLAVECGKVTSMVGGQYNCAVGKRVCRAGKWGICNYTGMTTQSTRNAPGLSAQTTANTSTSCVGNPCDPHCREFDSSFTPELGNGTVQGSSGITLVQSNPNADAGADADAGSVDPASVCSNTEQESTQIPLGMVLTVDRSGSMNGGSPTKWTKVKNALTTFVTSANISGMYAGLTLFPYAGGTSTQERWCDATYYSGSNMTVNIGAMPGAGNAQQTAVTSALTANTLDFSGRGTPMLAALNGAAERAWLWAQSVNKSKAIVVLVTDGLPEGDCDGCSGKKGKSKAEIASCAIKKVAEKAESYFNGSPSIETFVVGVQEDAADSGKLSNLNAVARAGSGGTRDAFLIDGSSGTAETQVLQKLNEIRSLSLPCDFDITPPSGGVINTSSATVKLTYKQNGVEQPQFSVPQVTSLGVCGTSDGFFYDASLMRISLCSATCNKAKGDFNSRLSVQYSCLPTCSSVSAQALPGPLDMMFLLDRSGSMGWYDGPSGAVNRWQAATSSIRSFVSSPDSEGIGMGISYFPYPTKCGNCKTGSTKSPWPSEKDDEGSYDSGVCDWSDESTSCSNVSGPSPNGTGDYRYFEGFDVSACSSDTYNPTKTAGRLSIASIAAGVALGTLPGSNNAQRDLIIGSLNTVVPRNGAGTPTKPALEGILKHAQANKVEGRKMVVVLITDGEPNSCSSTVDNVAAVAETYFNAPYSITTFVMCVGSDMNVTKCNTIAKKGSGNQFNAFVVNTGDPSDFIKKLNEIRQASLPCNYTIPQPSAGLLDYENPGVVLTTNGIGTTLTKVANSGACTSSGYYYNSNTNPTEINLCPTVCATAQTPGAKARLDVVFQCVGQFTSDTVSFDYSMADQCPPSTSPQWGDFSWIAQTPAGTSITFSVTTGDNKDSVGSEVVLKFTRTDLDNKTVCASLPGGCDPQVNIDTQSGGPLVGRPGDAYISETLKKNGKPNNKNFLRIKARFDPSVDKKSAPVLQNWKLQSACIQSE